MRIERELKEKKRAESVHVLRIPTCFLWPFKEHF